MNKENREMNKTQRIRMLKAMEFVACQINDENWLDAWCALGVADGDIFPGDLSGADPEGALDYYLEDDNFAYVMECFLNVMTGAKKSGGLYCDNVVSGFGKEQ